MYAATIYNNVLGSGKQRYYGSQHGLCHAALSHYVHLGVGIVSAYMYSYLEVRDNSVFGLVFNMKVTNWGWAVS